MRITAHNANVWVNCSGALSLQSQHPKPFIEGEEKSEAALEGLAFHEIAQRILKDNTLHRETFVGQLSAHGMPFDDDMYDHACEYVNDITSNEYRDLHVEERIDLDMLQPGAYSIADCWIVKPINRTIIVWDAKYGRSIVEVFECWQLLSYAIGLLNKIPHADRHGWKFDLRIFQPRGFHRDGICRSWVVTSEELIEYERVMILAAQKAAKGGDCKTGSHCYNASCRRTCELFQRQVYDGLDYVGSSVGNELRGVNLAVEITQLRTIQDQLKARLKALEESAIVYSRKGEALPGLIAAETFGRVRWKKDIDPNHVISMGDLLGVDLRKPRELATPTQILKKGVDASVIEEYSETPKTGWKLATATTDRIKMMFNVK